MRRVNKRSETAASRTDDSFELLKSWLSAQSHQYTFGGLMVKIKAP